ncbi:MAG TPA: STAS domain-containing protein [Solirubrobacteraceae bacterium]|nr:STAS domain-containing protein [Solirubrobacteraceae bacterium]
MEGEVTVTAREVGHRTVLAVGGEVDYATVPTVADAVDDALAAGAVELWLDFSKIEFMDSAGLHLLIETRRRVAELNRRLAIVCPSPTVLRLIEVAGLDGKLPVYPDRAAANRAA